MLTKWTLVLALTATVSPCSAESIAVCRLLGAEDYYAGKTVLVEGTVKREDDGAWLYDAECEKSILLQYPSEARPKPEFDVLRNDIFKAFSEIFVRRAVLIDDPHFVLRVVLQARFDTIMKTVGGQRVRVGEGFGAFHHASRRLLVTRIVRFEVIDGEFEADREDRH